MGLPVSPPLPAPVTTGSTGSHAACSGRPRSRHASCPAFRPGCRALAVRRGGAVVPRWGRQSPARRTGRTRSQAENSRNRRSAPSSTRPATRRSTATGGHERSEAGDAHADLGPVPGDVPAQKRANDVEQSHRVSDQPAGGSKPAIPLRRPACTARGRTPSHSCAGHGQPEGGHSCGNSSPPNGSPSWKARSGNAGEVVPARLTNRAPSPTHLTEVTRRRRRE